MKKIFFALTIVLCVLALQGSWALAQGAATTPLFTYSGDVLPSLDGWSFAYPEYEPIGAHVEDGVLHVTDYDTYGGSAIFYTRPWDVAPGELNIAEFDIKGKSCGGIGPNPGYVCIFFGTSDGNYNMLYTVYPDKVQSSYMDNGPYYGPVTISESYSFDTTQAFNTYKAVIVDGRARLYINGLLVMDQPAGIGIYDVKGVEFGAGSSPAVGEAYFDEVRAYRISRSDWKACIQPPSGMISWWPGDGNAKDLIGLHHGTLVNGATFVDGKVGQTFSLDGSGGYVRVTDRPSLDTPDGFTVDAWIYPRSFGGAEVIASKWDDPTGQWSWIFKRHNDGSGRLRIEISRGDHNALGDLGGATVLPLNTWSHVAATYDRSTSRLRLYVNGAVDSEGFASFPGTAINNSETDLLIGAVNGQLGSPGEYFNGLIDELELFNRALSIDELRAIYLAGSAGKCKPANRPPLANAGPDQTREMTSCAGASVILDGSASSDPDGDALTYTWTKNGVIIATGVNPTVTLSYGTHTITLTVDDGKGGSATDEVVINVVDTTAPVLNVTLSPNVLWPPNHKYVKVTSSITVIDACVETTTVTLVSATSSEPDNGLGDGDTANDIVINADGTISLRAERSGTGSGRVYTITYQATDAAGNTAAASATVIVPHDKR